MLDLTLSPRTAARHRVLSGGVVAAVVAGSWLGGAVVADAAVAGSATPVCVAGTCTVTFPGSAATPFVVPAGVDSVTATLAGGKGGNAYANFANGGVGGQVVANIPVTAGDTLTSVVGAAGSAATTDSQPVTSGAFGGGGAPRCQLNLGNSGTYSCSSGGGGGSFLFASTGSAPPRLLAAVGGGGGGGLGNSSNYGNAGGAGGAGSGSAANGAPGQDKANRGSGGGGTQTSGGAGSGDPRYNAGTNGTGPATAPDSLGIGGTPSGGDARVGTGGGGYYGGGAGGFVPNPDYYQASGGGSGFLTPAATVDSTSTNSGDGAITLSYQLVNTITITSATPTNPVVEDTYTPTATSTSGLPVTFGASGACTLTGGVVTFTHAGTCTVTANQAGDTSYPAAPQITQAITVGQAAQAITFTTTPPATPVIGDTYTPTTTGGKSGNPVTLAVTGPCTLNSTTGVVTFTGTGPCVVTANQAGTTDLTAAPTVIQTITVGAISSQVTYPLTGTATVSGKAPVPFGSIPLTATLTSTGSTTTGTGFTDGQLGSTPTTFTGTVFGFLPATITAHLENTAPVTATTSSTATTLTGSVKLVIDQVSVFGLGLITPGATCATTTPSTVTLTGAPGVLNTGGTLSGGSYTASTFSGCGFLAPFLEPQLNQIAGLPQAVTVTLGKPASTTTG